MTRVILQMISLGSLLIDRTSSSAGRSRCIGEGEVSGRSDRLWRNYWHKLGPSHPPQRSTTCAQTAKEMHGDLGKRSVAPWTYRLDRDVDRLPQEIAFAKCICQGCIIGQREDLSYNSVLVYAPLLVLRKTRCSRDPDKYVVKKESIKFPVACTCAVPKNAK